MQKAKFIIIIIFLSLLTPNNLWAQKVKETSRSILNFDNDWRFLKDDAQGAETPSFDDSKWRKLDVPHDWSIEGPYDVGVLQL